jgi:hypothetical protein
VLAADRFCQFSLSIMAGLESRLMAAVAALGTPLNLRLRLIALLRHNHGSIEAMERTRACCQRLLALYPTVETTLVTLHTLSRLVYAAPVQLAEHITLLAVNARDDPRKAVKLLALDDLAHLCRILSVPPPPMLISVLDELLGSSMDPCVLAAALSVLQELAAIAAAGTRPDAVTVLAFILHPSPRVARAAAALQVMLSQQAPEQASASLTATLGALAVHAGSCITATQLLTHTITLARLVGPDARQEAVLALLELVHSHAALHAPLMRAVRRIATFDPLPGLAAVLLPQIERLGASGLEDLAAHLLVTLVIAAHAAGYTNNPDAISNGGPSVAPMAVSPGLSPEASRRCEAIIESLFAHGRGWAVLRLGQHAASVGAHALAAFAFALAARRADSDVVSSYIKALHTIATAATAGPASDPAALLHATALLSGARSAAADFAFQCRFLERRCGGGLARVCDRDIRAHSVDDAQQTFSHRTELIESLTLLRHCDALGLARGGSGGLGALGAQGHANITYCSTLILFS